MPGRECGNHNEEKCDGEGENEKQVWVQADEGVCGEKREGVRGRTPAEEPDEAALEDEDDPDAGVEAAEVVCHQR